MHAITILHRILSPGFPEIHAKRLTSLLAAVEAVVSGNRLTLSELGRGLPGSTTVKQKSSASTGCSATIRYTLECQACTRHSSDSVWRACPCR